MTLFAQYNELTILLQRKDLVDSFFSPLKSRQIDIFNLSHFKQVGLFILHTDLTYLQICSKVVAVQPL